MSYINDKKKALITYKEEVLRDIKYFEKRIEESRLQKTNSCYFDDDDDSDPGDVLTLDMGPSVSELKSEQTLLQTCLHATQELTNLCVLQSEVNVMVCDPVYERESLITEEGTWREVTADCRVDLVPFTISFYTHQAIRPFGPTSYRGLRVMPVKTAHETELAKSILPRIGTPSDAVEVLRSYAAAHRSRRTTLARLAEKYSNSLFMEPKEDGGYILKCANLLEVSWTLENKWSPVALFHHKMKFDLEYMDEAYVRIISQAHRELSDPTLETDERTRLMSKIIATCLEARGPTQELYESLESDIESEKLRKRRTTLDQEIEEPINKKKKDSEVMAPPTSLPKKKKPKGKENNIDNKKESKALKRPVPDTINDGAKKTKYSVQDNILKNKAPSNKKYSSRENVDVVEKVLNSDNGVKKTAADKAQVENEVIISKSNKEKNTNKKKPNSENVAKNADSKTMHNSDEQTVNKVSDDKFDRVNNNVGNSKSTEKVSNSKSSDPNLKNKNSTDTSAPVKNAIASLKTIDKEVMKDKSIKQKKVVAAVSSNKLHNVKKSCVVPDNIERIDEHKKESTNDITNLKKAGTHKVMKNVKGSKDQNDQGGSQNNDEKSSKSKVSNVQKNMNSGYKNAINKISVKKTNSKATLTGNMKENVVSINDKLTKDNNGNKKNVTKVVSKESPKSTNVVSNLDSINDKAVITKSSGIKKHKSKNSVNVDIIKSKSDSKSNKNGNVAKDNVTENINKPVNVNTTYIAKENPSSSVQSIDNTKFNNKTDLTVKKQKSAKNVENISKPHDTLQKVVVKNSKNKIIENIYKKDIVTEAINTVDEKLPMDIIERNSIEVNNKTGYHSMNQKNSTNKEISTTGNANLNVKNKFENVVKSINSKNIKANNGGIQNSLKLLNPRNKILIAKSKLTNSIQKDSNAQKGYSEKKKIYTKIPQKLMSVREQIIKRNPLRVSPRKPKSNMTINSQDMSKGSQRSVQKPVTGIPRLMNKVKKAIHKS